MTLEEFKKKLRKAYAYYTNLQSNYNLEPTSQMYRFLQGKTDSYLDVLEWLTNIEELKKDA